jgi:transcriptional regulator GlxA family with amidase domain
MALPPPGPLGREQRRSLVNEAIHYFANHYGEPIHIAGVASQLGVSEGCLALCFDHCRGHTPWQTLQQMRLNRLYEAIAHRPADPLEQLVRRCGLLPVTEANRAFQQAFGIDLGSFRRTSHRAAEDRRFRRSHPDSGDLVLKACALSPPRAPAPAAPAPGLRSRRPGSG